MKLESEFWKEYSNNKYKFYLNEKEVNILNACQKILVHDNYLTLDNYYFWKDEAIDELKHLSSFSASKLPRIWEARMKYCKGSISSQPQYSRLWREIEFRIPNWCGLNKLRINIIRNKINPDLLYEIKHEDNELFYWLNS